MVDKPVQRRANHLVEAFKQYWYLLGIVIIIMTMWFKLEFVVAAINPDSLIEYNIQQSIKNTKSEIRWCLTKLAWDAVPARDKMMACAD